MRGGVRKLERGETCGSRPLLDVGDGRSTTTVFVISHSLGGWQTVGRRKVAADRPEGLSIITESLPQGRERSVLIEESSSSEIPEVDRKANRKGEEN